MQQQLIRQQFLDKDLQAIDQEVGQLRQLIQQGVDAEVVQIQVDLITSLLRMAIIRYEHITTRRD